jgi:hypothetical protein
VHRIVWILHHGSLDNDLVIDHLNGDQSDNRLCNLRAITPDVNARNQRRYANTSTGITGVNIYTNKAGYEMAVATYRTNGKQKHKSFSTNKYGTERALLLAQTWRDTNIKALELQGIFYSERHGT